MGHKKKKKQKQAIQIRSVATDRPEEIVLTDQTLQTKHWGLIMVYDFATHSAVFNTTVVTCSFFFFKKS